MIEKEYEPEMVDSNYIPNQYMLQNEILMIDGKSETILDLLLKYDDYQEAKNDMQDYYTWWGKIFRASMILPSLFIVMELAYYGTGFLPLKNNGDSVVISLIRLLMFSGLSISSIIMMINPLVNKRYINWAQKWLRKFNFVQQKEEFYLIAKNYMHTLFQQKEFQYQYMAQIEYRKNKYQSEIKQINTTIYLDEYRKLIELLKNYEENSRQLLTCFSFDISSAIELRMRIFNRIEILNMDIQTELEKCRDKNDATQLFSNTPAQSSLIDNMNIQNEFILGYEDFLDKHKIKEMVRQPTCNHSDNNNHQNIEHPEKNNENQLASKLKSYL
jgi:hypothetical protein